MIERYNLQSRVLEHAYNVGVWLNGIDIAADDSFILAAEDATGIAQGTVHKVDLATGAVTNLNYDLGFSETGGWEVAIGSQGRALLSTQYGFLFASGQSTFREIDLAPIR